MKVFGIPTCGSVRKVLQWAKQNNISVRFHNFRTRGLSSEQLSAFLEQIPADALLNRKGLAWRNLSETEKRLVQSPNGIQELLLKNPILIKRPVVVRADGKIIVGVQPEQWGLL